MITEITQLGKLKYTGLSREQELTA
jgi:hypothetical protein